MSDQAPSSTARRPSHTKQTPADPSQDVVVTDEDVIGCDGGGGPLGHPLVYLNLERAGVVECPYCSKRFIHEESDEAE